MSEYDGGECYYLGVITRRWHLKKSAGDSHISLTCNIYTTCRGNDDEKHIQRKEKKASELGISSSCSFFPGLFAYQKRVKLHLPDERKKVYTLRHRRLNFSYYGGETCFRAIVKKFRRNNLSEMIKLWMGGRCCSRELVSIIASSIQLFFAFERLFEGTTRISRLEEGKVIARRADESESQNRSSGNPREILETDVSANESIWRTSRRQGEAPYYTPHPTPPRALRHCLLHLLFLLSPSGSSAFSAIVVVTAFCHLGWL